MQMVEPRCWRTAYNQDADVVLLGPPGVGKTHLAISLAIAAAQKGRRVYYRQAVHGSAP